MGRGGRRLPGRGPSRPLDTGPPACARASSTGAHPLLLAPLREGWREEAAWLSCTPSPLSPPPYRLPRRELGAGGLGEPDGRRHALQRGRNVGQRVVEGGLGGREGCVAREGEGEARGWRGGRRERGEEGESFQAEKNDAACCLGWTKGARRFWIGSGWACTPTLHTQASTRTMPGRWARAVRRGARARPACAREKGGTSERAGVGSAFFFSLFLDRASPRLVLLIPSCLASKHTHQGRPRPGGPPGGRARALVCAFSCEKRDGLNGK